MEKGEKIMGNGEDKEEKEWEKERTQWKKEGKWRRHRGKRKK